MTRAQRSYQAFLKTAKAEFGVSHKQAQQMYRTVRGRLDRAPMAKDIKAHPRIAKQEAKRAAEPKAKPAARPKAPPKPAKAKPTKEKPRKAKAPPKPTKEQRQKARQEFYEGDYEIFEDPLESEY